MSNTKDTPMDYKQFEGHTPGPWKYIEGDNATLIAAAPDLLKENQSLKLELQKQKEEIEQLRDVIVQK